MKASELIQALEDGWSVGCPSSPEDPKCAWIVIETKTLATVRTYVEHSTAVLPTEPLSVAQAFDWWRRLLHTPQNWQVGYLRDANPGYVFVIAPRKAPEEIPEVRPQEAQEVDLRVPVSVDLRSMLLELSALQDRDGVPDHHDFRRFLTTLDASQIFGTAVELCIA